MAKFYGNILNPSENIVKSFRGATFLTHTVYIHATCKRHVEKKGLARAYAM